MTSAAAVRLLLSDVDGTLLTDDRVLTDRAMSAVHALKAAGVAFALASSRPPRGLGKFIGPLGLTLPLAGLNGGILVNPDLSVIETKGLDRPTAHAVVEVLNAAKLDIWIYTDTDWFVMKADGAHVGAETWILGFKPTVVTAYDDVQISKAIKIVGVSDDHSLIVAGEAALVARLGSLIAAARSQPHFIDVTSPQANKGIVVSGFAHRLDLTRDQIATIGDMPNDVLMFKQSGLSIAMGNASADVQAAATKVTSPNSDEGFARAVEALLLERQEGAGPTLDSAAAVAPGPCL